MKKTRSTPPAAAVSGLADLYETDEVAWLETSARLIRRKKLADLDHVHLAEYLNDMAKRDRREVKSRLITLFVHLLKWEFQPTYRTGGWKASILHQRVELSDILASKTLRNHAHTIWNEAYRVAVEEAGAETGLDEKAFPAECSYTLDFILGGDFPADD